jgi:endonuclease YncB( thermonuclease family)
MRQRILNILLLCLCAVPAVAFAADTPSCPGTDAAGFNPARTQGVSGGAAPCPGTDAAGIQAERERIYAAFHPAFAKLFSDKRPLTRILAMQAAAGILRDRQLADTLRPRLAKADFPEQAVIAYFIAAATDADADVEAFLKSLPESYAGCRALYFVGGRVTENRAWRMADQVYRYASGGRFPDLAEPKAWWSKRYLLVDHEGEEEPWQSDPRLLAWLKKHPKLDDTYDAQEEQAYEAREKRPETRLYPDSAAEQARDGVSKAIRAFVNHPEPLVRLMAFRLLSHHGDDAKEDKARRLDAATEPREKLLLYSELGFQPPDKGERDVVLLLAEEYPETPEDYARLRDWERIVYDDGTPTLETLARWSEITRNNSAKTLPVLRRALPWAAPCLPPDKAGEYARLTAGVLQKDESYQWAGKVLDVYSGDTLLVTLNDLGDSVLYRLQAVDCPYPGQPFHDEALALTKKLVLGQQVGLFSQGADGFGRRLGNVDYDNGVKILGAVLAARGLARVTDPEADSGVYAVAEKRAREARLGVWSLDKPESPADYRKRMIAEQGIDPEKP